MKTTMLIIAALFVTTLACAEGLPITHSTPVQVFTPDRSLSRTLVLGTKGMGCYSTVYPQGSLPEKTVQAVRYTCTVTGTNTPVAVKRFLNGIETHFLTVDAETLGISYRGTDTTKVCYRTYSSSSSVTCGIEGMN